MAYKSGLLLLIAIAIVAFVKATARTSSAGLVARLIAGACCVVVQLLLLCIWCQDSTQASILLTVFTGFSIALLTLAPRFVRAGGVKGEASVTSSWSIERASDPPSSNCHPSPSSPPPTPGGQFLHHSESSGTPPFHHLPPPPPRDLDVEMADLQPRRWLWIVKYRTYILSTSAQPTVIP